MRVQSLDQEYPLQRGMPTHYSILAWRIPWTEESGGLQSTGLQRVGHYWRYLACNTWIIESHFESDPNEISVSPIGELLVCAKYYSRAIGLMLFILICSQSLCNNNRGCVWKTAESSSCLHMPESSSKKYILNKSLRVTISLVNKLKTIKSMKDGFVCPAVTVMVGAETLARNILQMSWERRTRLLWLTLNYQFFSAWPYLWFCSLFFTPYGMSIFPWNTEE